VGVTGAGRGTGVLAIDAGNSKTDLAIVDPSGAVLGVARGDGFLPHIVGPEAAVAGLATTVEKAATEAGLASGEGPLVDHVSACLANLDFPVEQERLQRAVDSHGWGRSSEVTNDTFALLRAGVEGPRGIAVICGAGINCTGVLPDGRSVRFASVGWISGDWGGGGFLWQEAMWWAARAEDGRGGETALMTALPEYFGLASVQALIEAVHLGDVAYEQCLELVPLLFEVARGGDQVARDIVARQAREVVALVEAAARRLDVISEPIDVVLGGGVLTAGHALLMDAIDNWLRTSVPGATTQVVTAPPVLGAALLGMDHVGASAEAKAALREANRWQWDPSRR
jgi:N-acetylglucosamine kinase-like BadF-type ATPase